MAVSLAQGYLQASSLVRMGSVSSAAEPIGNSHKQILACRFSHNFSHHLHLARTWERRDEQPLVEMIILFFTENGDLPYLIA